MHLTEYFKKWLESTHSPWFIGELAIEEDHDSGSSATSPVFRICHREDLSSEDSKKEILQEVRSFEDKLKLVKYTSDGSYRNLRGERNLKRGWQMRRLSLDELIHTLELFYPTSICNLAYAAENKLPITSFEETASRQTGMYRKLIELKPEAVLNIYQALCAKRCMKVPLWHGDSYEPNIQNEWPILCPEICSLFITAAQQAQQK